MDWFTKFNKLRKHLGDETVLTEIINYFSSYDINEFCNSVISDYDLEDEFDTDE